MEQLNFENPWRHRAGSDDDNEEGPKDDIAVQFGFDDRSIRAAFVAKVFALVTVMFAITAAFSAVPIYNKDFKKWCNQEDHWWCVYVAMGVFFIFYITLMCCGRARRCFPCNLFILTCFTFSAATMTMFITATYSADAVLISLLITTGCSASIILFAATTKKDLTSCLGVAFILGICLMLFGLMACIFCIFLNWQFLYIVYAVLGALLCMFYLAIDIQLIMGGRRVEISPEEYIFAATHVFVDILGMFLNILGVVGNA
ncbi:Protein lifeguard 2 [Caenorhabditis elegans]|uniref:Protein lifeguard 2 n=1 Tax=Caenorhabditis elegans TaxID=6239 RepID=Q9N3Y5_CAEEL|nr:Protein lifeguard 2 [Caenorhabditis elegans]CCD71171.1 Protein lifeguard 2 [Caenorhabditis elegans]|eukprot:NP_501350.3 Uncharacterized protein CELE_Y42H9AR.2 [Caenorhabditis elegans]